ncbi:signal peptidase I [Microbacterium rhizophilus]|uniref:signal peptidase I n=1 Tax=Microbacterium rhizophilus TaxID=3138934 RepID=UPI0031EAADCF
MTTRANGGRALTRVPTLHDSPWRIAAHAAAVAVGAALLVLVVAILVIPRLAGGTSLTILTGSMEPNLRPGDVVVTRGIDEADVCAGVAIGDIITYLPRPDDPALITHRVIGKTIGTYEDGTDCRLITQGDANSAPDEPVSPAQVRGVFLYGVPQLGWLRNWVADNQIAVIIGALVGLGALWIWDGMRPPRTRVITTAAPAAGSTTGPTTAAPLADDREYDLRLRELAIREREVAVRETEIAVLLGVPAALTTAPVRPDTDVHADPRTRGTERAERDEVSDRIVVGPAGSAWSEPHPASGVRVAGLSRSGRALAGLLALIILLVAAYGVVSASGATVFGAATGADVLGGGSVRAGSGGAYPVAPAEAPGAATSVSGETAAVPGDTSSGEAAIVAAWDGPTVHLDWRGDGVATAEASFVGDRVASPGDRVARALRIGNAGPAAAVMTVSLGLAEEINSANPELGERIELFWSAGGVEGAATFARLRALDDGGAVVVAEVRVPQGAETTVTMGFAMPADVGDQGALSSDTVLSFDVIARMQGDTGEPAEPVADELPPLLAVTGSDAALLIGLAAVGGLILLAGLIFLFARRARRCDHCGARIARDEPWVTLHREDGRRQTLCLACAPTGTLGTGARGPGARGPGARG